MVKSVFYSFHYGRDVHRVQLVRNINSLSDAPVITSQKWEAVRYETDAAIKRWIDKEMNWKKAVIVLVGRETANRKYVQYEIERAWQMRKPLLGVRIHGLSSMSDGADTAGPNPFDMLGLPSVPLFDPTHGGFYGPINTQITYGNLMYNLPRWAEQGVIRP